MQLERDVWVINGSVSFFQGLHFEPLKSESSLSWVTLTAPHTLLERKTLHNAATAVVAVFGESTEIAQPYMVIVKTSHVASLSLSNSIIFFISSSGPEELMEAFPKKSQRSLIETSDLL